jgi:hypothetical protein
MDATTEYLNNFVSEVTASLNNCDILNKIRAMKRKPFDKLLKIKLNENDKTPVNKWSSPLNQTYNIDEDRYNVGIPTGKVNNIIVVDVDVKKDTKKELDGIAKLKEYIKEHGRLNTLTVRSPRGGIHYYFKYHDNDNDDLKFIKKHHLYTRAGMGGYSIDIRSDKGYIVAPPSIINNITYQVVNKTDISSMPVSLAHFLNKIDEENDQRKMKRLRKKLKESIESNIQHDTEDDEDDTNTDNSHKYLDNLHLLKTLHLTWMMVR